MKLEREIGKSSQLVYSYKDNASGISRSQPSAKSEEATESGEGDSRRSLLPQKVVPQNSLSRTLHRETHHTTIEVVESNTERLPNASSISTMKKSHVPAKTSEGKESVSSAKTQTAPVKKLERSLSTRRPGMGIGSTSSSRTVKSMAETQLIIIQ